MLATLLSVLRSWWPIYNGQLTSIHDPPSSPLASCIGLSWFLLQHLAQDVLIADDNQLKSKSLERDSCTDLTAQPHATFVDSIKSIIVFRWHFMNPHSHTMTNLDSNP